MSTENTTTEIRLAVKVGKDVYEIKPTANGVNIRNGNGRSVFFPTANVNELTGAINTAAALIPTVFPAGAPAPTRTAPATRKATGNAPAIRRNRDEVRLNQPAGSLRGADAAAKIAALEAEQSAPASV